MIYLSTRTINTTTQHRKRTKLDSRKISPNCRPVLNICSLFQIPSANSNSVYRIFVCVVVCYIQVGPKVGRQYSIDGSSQILTLVSLTFKLKIHFLCSIFKFPAIIHNTCKGEKNNYCIPNFGPPCILRLRFILLKKIKYHKVYDTIAYPPAS